MYHLHFLFPESSLVQVQPAGLSWSCNLQTQSQLQCMTSSKDSNFDRSTTTQMLNIINFKEENEDPKELWLTWLDKLPQGPSHFWRNHSQTALPLPASWIEHTLSGTVIKCVIQVSQKNKNIRSGWKWYISWPYEQMPMWLYPKFVASLKRSLAQQCPFLQLKKERKNSNLKLK